MSLSSPDYPLAWTQPDKVRTFLADMAPQNVGKRVAELRKARDLSQEALADALGVRARTISRWENGVTGGLYDRDILEKLATVLGVDADDIIGPKQPAQATATEMADLRSQLDRIETTLSSIVSVLDAMGEASESSRELFDSKLERLLRGEGRGRRSA